jgi:hypothetical protein
MLRGLRERVKKATPLRCHKRSIHVSLENKNILDLTVTITHCQKDSRHWQHLSNFSFSAVTIAFVPVLHPLLNHLSVRIVEES